jgi:hypothetical protein
MMVNNIRGIIIIMVICGSDSKITKSLPSPLDGPAGPPETDAGFSGNHSVNGNAICRWRGRRTGFVSSPADPPFWAVGGSGCFS